jgi:hypothetical protein
MRSSFTSPTLVNPRTVGPKNSDSSSGCATTRTGRFEISSEGGMSAGLVGTKYARRIYNAQGTTIRVSMASRSRPVRLR